MGIEERLQEMGLFYRMGGTSADVAGSNVLARLIDGDDAGGGGGGVTGAPTPWLAMRVAETARACLSLHESDQVTVFEVYCSGHPSAAAQASALGVSVSALSKRVRRIHLLLEDWLSPEARERRRAAAREAEAQANLAASMVRDEKVRKAEKHAKSRRAAVKSRARGRSGVSRMEA